jgi:hypothetical protein
MTRQEFVKIRRRQGRTAIVTGAHDCPNCGRRCVNVITRSDGQHQFIRWGPGKNDPIHSCHAATRPADAR